MPRSEYSDRNRSLNIHATNRQATDLEIIRILHTLEPILTKLDNHSNTNENQIKESVIKKLVELTEENNRDIREIKENFAAQYVEFITKLKNAENINKTEMLRFNALYDESISVLAKLILLKNESDIGTKIEYLKTATEILKKLNKKFSKPIESNASFWEHAKNYFSSEPQVSKSSYEIDPRDQDIKNLRRLNDNCDKIYNNSIKCSTLESSAKAMLVIGIAAAAAAVVTGGLAIPVLAIVAGAVAGVSALQGAGIFAKYKKVNTELEALRERPLATVEDNKNDCCTLPIAVAF